MIQFHHDELWYHFHSGINNCQFVKTDLKLFSYGHTVRIISCSTHAHTQSYPLNLILLPLSEGLGSLLGLASPLWVSPPPVASYILSKQDIGFYTNVDILLLSYRRTLSTLILNIVFEVSAYIQYCMVHDNPYSKIRSVNNGPSC